MKYEREFRAATVAAPTSEDLILEGTAVVLDTETFIGIGDKGYYEKINSHAFDSIDLSKADVFMRYNHDTSPLILARTRNKSLELFKVNNEIKVRAKLQPGVQQHEDIYNLVKSGLLSSMSFGFIVDDNGEKIYRDKDGVIHREITKVKDLFEVSIVDDPAYPQATIQARSLESLESDLKALENAKSLDRQKLDLLKEKLKIKLILK